jgi:hypothetical protein
MQIYTLSRVGQRFLRQNLFPVLTHFSSPINASGKKTVYMKDTARRVKFPEELNPIYLLLWGQFLIVGLACWINKTIRNIFLSLKKMNKQFAIHGINVCQRTKVVTTVNSFVRPVFLQGVKPIMNKDLLASSRL